MYKLHLGSNKDVLKTFEDNSVDSIVTDPPYEYGFMSKAWDSTGIAYDVELWKECLRVVKPGGYIMAFGSSRTHHRLMVAIEDAGFEIRDTVCWVFGSGFPKSLNIGKKVDEIQGNKREDLGEYNPHRDNSVRKQKIYKGIGGEGKQGLAEKKCGGLVNLTKGTSDFEGWGTALKPAVEYICMARKPLSEKTVAENCLKWGTGGINIDESRVKAKPRKTGTKPTSDDATGTGNTLQGSSKNRQAEYDEQNLGRFPANLIHDNSEEVTECFPDVHGAGKKREKKEEYNRENSIFGIGHAGGNSPRFGDSGNASRFFKSIIYEAKASKAERNRGCESVFNLFEQSEGLEEKIGGGMTGTADQTLLTGSGNIRNNMARNNHPTVKPIALMEYLIKMVTPKGGIVLDPFNGSGSTGCAAVKNRFDYIGIDITEDYIKISEKRIKSYQR